MSDKFVEQENLIRLIRFKKKKKLEYLFKFTRSFFQNIDIFLLHFKIIKKEEQVTFKAFENNKYYL